MKIKGWKKIHERFYENINSGAAISIIPTGKSGILTRGYVVARGWVVELHGSDKSKFENMRSVFPTKKEAYKEAFRFMKAHPRG